MERILALALVWLLALSAAAAAHGPVPRVANLGLNAAPAESLPHLAGSWCTGDPGRTTDDTEHALSNLPDVKFIYAYASDQPNQFRHHADEMQRTAKRIAELVAGAPGSAKSVRFDLGTACGPQYLDIQTVRLPHPLSDYTSVDANSRVLFGMAQELRELGVTSSDRARRYVIYADEMYTGDAVGYALAPGDDRPGPENFINQGGSSGYVFGTGRDPSCDANWIPANCGPFQDVNLGDYWEVHPVYHELWHTLGGVVASARHASSPPGHCFDEYDVLCGQHSGALTFPCDPGPDNLELDCGDDDYFNPAGAVTNPSGDPIWNTYNSVFLCADGRCANAPPVVSLAASTTNPVAGETVALQATATDDHAVARYEWDLDGDGTFEASTGTAASNSVSFAAPGVRSVEVRAVDSDEIARAASVTLDVTVPPGSGDPDGGAGPVDGRAALLSSLRVGPRSFRAARKGASIAAPVGTTVSYGLSTAVSVRFAVDRRRGRKAVRKCRRASRRSDRRRRCRWGRLRGSFTHEGAVGSNSFRFTGRLARRSLRPGAYRLVAKPAGGKPARRAFKIVRR